MESPLSQVTRKEPFPLLWAGGRCFLTGSFCSLADTWSYILVPFSSLCHSHSKMIGFQCLFPQPNLSDSHPQIFLLLGVKGRCYT